MALHDDYRANSVRYYPLRNLFVPFPFVGFILTLFCDTLYWQTANLMWKHFSSWLLFAGLVFGAFGLLAGIVDLLRPKEHGVQPTLFEILGYLAVLVLALFNSLVHAADGWTGVVPDGIILSFLTVAFVVATVCFSAAYTRPHGWRTYHD
ncbi:DUF2231 domain-containing protein [Rhizobium sp. L1K21]|uniref:DUF2231 domain-containing protein n=1 Tax=Rhizobium sp. L1K21 TaxID=2954933 RepID=UPI0027961D85|nr:DUF2231 domain-containing protein [Rhizobium sp. L1K21]MCO6187829.1 DUF2231 domain-containing protein [Rhizobium sp. L1K21]